MTGRQPLLGAHVHPVAALWVLRNLDTDRFEDGIRLFEYHGRPGVARALGDALAQLQAAAAAWEAHAAAGSGSGTPELPQTPTPAESDSLAVDALLATAEAAEILDSSEEWVRRLLRSGELTGTRKKGRWAVSRRSVMAYMTRSQEDIA